MWSILRKFFNADWGSLKNTMEGISSIYSTSLLQNTLSKYHYSLSPPQANHLRKRSIKRKGSRRFLDRDLPDLFFVSPTLQEGLLHHEARG